jgi:hypothetical protein
MSETKKVKLRLHKNYEKFTGMLNNCYPVKDGVTIVSNDLKTINYLKREYGATVLPDENAEELKK